MVREDRAFFLGAAMAGLALRLIFLFWFPAITDDSHVYMDLGRNWLEHGVYGQSEMGQVAPTDARLPGYPAFLAAMFWVFGRENIGAVLLVQILLDLLSCLIIADVARRMIAEPRAGRTAFLLAAMCPFLANYAAAVLTESLEILFTATALDCAVAALEGMDESGGPVASRASNERPASGRRRGATAGIPTLWVGAGAAIGACILLRPDGGILLGAMGLYLALVMWRSRRNKRRMAQVAAAGLLVLPIALAPLVPWTIRNFRTLHHFQPLAPRYANETDEVAPTGFNRWVRTWMLDYASVEEIYWNVPGAKIDAGKLPARAFDAGKDATLALIADYNQTPDLTLQLDARFNELAKERIAAHRFRYYVELPLMRVADMWMRPRTELLPSDPRWWEFNDEPKWSVVAVGLGLLNLLYVAAALLGLMCRRGELRYAGLLVGFVLLRSAFLATVENPETRYTLECYPAILVLATASLARLGSAQRVK